jgi:hypothetical protein
MRSHEWGAAAGALLVVVAACSPGIDSDDVATTTTETTPEVTSTTAVPPTTNTTSPTTTSIPLPGEPIDFGPAEGDILAVVGVSHDDTLNLRALPGPDQEILETIEPTFAALIALGETRDLQDAFWIKVDHEGTTGWVHLGFIAYLGSTEDVTSSVVDDLGDIPVADSMTELGRVVAETIASEEPASRIIRVVDETVGDLGEVTYDVVGLGDDAVRGVRLHVFGEPTQGGFSLNSVEVTLLCGRGVTGDGLCV